MFKAILPLAACAALLTACGPNDDAAPVVAEPTANEAVDTTPVDPATMTTPGANSYTEAQARSAIEAAGYTGVGTLMQTPEGVWQGTAMKDGASVSVSVDYQGNVTGA